MLVFRLLSHVWKQSPRSASRGRQTAGNIFVLVMVVLVALNLLGLGFFLQEYLRQREPGTDPLFVLNGWLFYYLGIDLLLRQMLQRVPGQAIVPYPTLPVRKSLLVHLLLLRSFFSFFNLLPWLLFVPLSVNMVFPVAGLWGTLGWLVTLVSLVAANSLLNLLLKKLGFHSLPLALAVGAAIGVVFALDFIDAVSLPDISRAAMGSVIGTPLASAGALLVPALLYALVFSVVRGRMHLDQLAPAAAISKETPSWYRFLESSGPRGRFLALELKMFFRNRRSRGNIIVAFAVFPLGILFYEMILHAEGDPYPLPSPAVLETARISDPRCAVKGEGRRLVTFRLEGGIVPPFAHAYVTGNQPELADWDPSALPLLRNPDSTWSRSFLIQEGSSLRYCFTLGAWQTEEKVGDGSEPPVYILPVRSDTTISRSAIVWRTPEIPLLMKINLLYWGLLVTGILMFAYGQFFLAWNSTYFDALLTWRLRYRWLLETKVLLLFATGLLSYVLTTPYAIMDRTFLLYNSLAFLYNIGVNSYVLLYLASRSRKRFELGESIFSQQGKGAAQFVAVVPMWILPLIAYGVLEGMGVPYALYILFGGLGLLGLALYRPLCSRIIGVMERQRYAIAEGFRQGGTA